MKEKYLVLRTSLGRRLEKLILKYYMPMYHRGVLCITNDNYPMFLGARFYDCFGERKVAYKIHRENGPAMLNEHGHYWFLADKRQFSIGYCFATAFETIGGRI